MARNPKFEHHNHDKGRIRFFYGEVEGNNQTLQETMRNVVSAMNRPMPPALPRRTPPMGELPTMPEPDLYSDLPDAVDEVAEPLADGLPAAQQSTNGGPRRRRGDGQKTDHNAGLAPVGSLELSPKGKPSLRDFVKEKLPKTDEQYVLVIVYYLKQTLGVEKVDANHVLTCFKNIGTKRVPADLRGTIRNVWKKKAWLSAAEADNIGITNAGIEVVDHDLPNDNGDNS